MKTKQKVYDVHLYPVVRVKVPGIAARSQKEAINKALDLAGRFYGLFDNLRNAFGWDTAYAESVTEYLVGETVVDGAGSDDYLLSRTYLDAGITSPRFSGTESAFRRTAAAGKR